MGDRMKRWYLWILFSSLLVISLTLLDLFGTWQVSKSAADFGIEEYYSSQDKNNNGIDDVHDFVLGARAYIQTNPRYGSRYYAGGTPNDGYGVCTDVISYAFAAAGYSLKDMVNDDIIRNQELYGIDIPDANIDYRRVDNLQIYFQRHATELSSLCEDPKEWQPGDIVVYRQHIGICSDRRNSQGYPLLIHFDAWGPRERDELHNSTIIAHYRWQ